MIDEHREYYAYGSRIDFLPHYASFQIFFKHSFPTLSFYVCSLKQRVSHKNSWQISISHKQILQHHIQYITLKYLILEVF